MRFWRTLVVVLFLPVYGAANQDNAVSRITLAVKAQLNAMIQYTSEKRALAPIPTWIDESHHACVGVGTEETLTCEIEVLQSHCKTQTTLPREACLSLADHYASLYMNRKVFAGWKSRDFPENSNVVLGREFRLERLRNRFVALRKVLETITPACKTPWTTDCEIGRLTRFCTEYAARTAFPWPACVAGILESWRI
jgi:hypothetical protein